MSQACDPLRVTGSPPGRLCWAVTRVVPGLPRHQWVVSFRTDSCWILSVRVAPGFSPPAPSVTMIRASVTRPEIESMEFALTEIVVCASPPAPR